MNERHIIVAAGVAAGTYAAARYGSAIPAVGGISPYFVAIAGGLVLAAWFGKEGTTGAVIEGAGYGLVAFGTFGIAAGK